MSRIGNDLGAKRAEGERNRKVGEHADRDTSQAQAKVYTRGQWSSDSQVIAAN